MNDKIVFDLCSDIIILLDSSFNALQFNKKAEVSFQISKKNIIGFNFFEVMKKHGIMLSFSFHDLNLIEVSNTHFFEGDILLKHHCGHQKYHFHWTINHHFSYKKHRFILIGKDVSETVSYKNSLQDSQIYLRNIIENIPQYVYWKDRNFVYQGCNNLVAQYLGLKSPQEIIGKTDSDFNWDQRRVNFLHHTDELILREGITNIVEDAIPKENGSTRIMLSSKAPLRNENNEIVGILGISFDITDRKKMEKELEKAKVAAEIANQAKSEFIANMSHDIRTPITGILGLIQELINLADDSLVSLQHLPPIQRTELTAKYRFLLNQLIEKIQEDGQLLLGAVDELLQLLNEILETMRLESGKISEKVESFDLCELVEHNMELMLPVAQHKKLELTCEIDERIPAYFTGLRNYLDRTLLNLLSNALKFTEIGFVKIKIQFIDDQDTAYRLGERIQLKITVEDSGIGIPEDKFDTIFEHFSRLTPSYQGLYKGAGLGLYTVKRYIEAMGAKIRVESEVGKGTRFIITLPLTVSDHSDREKISYRLANTKNGSLIQSIPSTTNARELAKIEMTPTILIVEDNRIAARAVYSNICSQTNNCRCDIASDGKQALKMAQDHHYDLIIMDIGLPDMEGTEVTRQIRALETPIVSQVPIVALTGHGNNSDKVKEALSAGMQEVFTKPLSPSALESLLQRYIFSSKQELAPMKAEATVTSERDATQIIDWAKCLEQHSGDENLIHELLAALTMDLKISREKIAKAYSNHDNAMLREELHHVRGGVVYLTLPQLDKAFAEFHETVKEKSHDSDQLQKTYEHLQQAIDAFLEAMEKNKRGQ
ncbi:ATP-binding protein [Legionella sp.]|uniref:PAS domain-containing hybrid sensor histidine kinase/response regulator n=1 Tax=Legionella sp. TaxID=459 RepID=UPI0032203B2E